MKKFIPIVIVLLFSFGCSPAFKIERYVDDSNNFISTRLPKKVISVDKKFKYAGSSNNEATSTKGTSFSKNYFIFVNSDENSKIKSGFIIKIAKLHNGYWNSDIYKGYKNKIREKNIKINNENYHNLIAIAKNIQGNLLQEKGYITPDISMVWGIGKNIGPRNDTRILIYYFEDIDSKNLKIYGENSPVDWSNPELFTDKHEEAIYDFIERAKKSFYMNEDLSISQPPASFKETKSPKDMTNISGIKLYKSEINNSSIFVDMSKWEDAKDLVKDAEFNFKLKGKDVYGSLATSEISVDSDFLNIFDEAMAREFASSFDEISNLHFKKQLVHGIDTVHIAMNAKRSGIKFYVEMNIYGNESGFTMHMVATGANLKDKYKDEMKTFLNGFYLQ